MATITPEQQGGSTGVSEKSDEGSAETNHDVWRRWNDSSLGTPTATVLLLVLLATLLLAVTLDLAGTSKLFRVLDKPDESEVAVSDVSTSGADRVTQSMSSARLTSEKDSEVSKDISETREVATRALTEAGSPRPSLEMNSVTPGLQAARTDSEPGPDATAEPHSIADPKSLHEHEAGIAEGEPRLDTPRVKSTEMTESSTSAVQADTEELPALAIAPFDAQRARLHQNQWAEALNIEVKATNSVGMEFVLIPPGEFLMGSPPSDPEASRQETRTAQRSAHEARFAANDRRHAAALENRHGNRAVGRRVSSPRGKRISGIVRELV